MFFSRTTDEEFNPKPANPKLIFHSLADLLSQVCLTFSLHIASVKLSSTLF